MVALNDAGGNTERYARKSSCLCLVVLEISGVVPLTVGRSPVRSGPVHSSPSQSCRWSLGLLPVQWRVTIGQADCRDRGGRALRGLWLDITRKSRAVHWWGLRRGTMGWDSLLPIPELPCLKQKPAEQLLRNQKYPSNETNWNLHSGQDILYISDRSS